MSDGELATRRSGDIDVDCSGVVEAGLDVLKFFPAEASGGVQALAAPFPEVRFMPTGVVGWGRWRT